MRIHIYIHGAAGITQDLVRFARLLLGAALMVYMYVLAIRRKYPAQIRKGNVKVIHLPK